MMRKGRLTDPDAPSVVKRTVEHGLRLWQQIAIAAAIVFPSAYAIDQLFDRRPPVVIASIKLEPEAVSPGQDVQVLVEMTGTRPCNGTLTRTLASTERAMQVVEQAPISVAPGEPTTTIKTMPVPAGFPIGVAVYRSEAIFNCNALQAFWPIKVRGPEVQFAIAPAAEKTALMSAPLPARKPAPHVIRQAAPPAAQTQATNPLSALFRLPGG